MKYSIGVLFVFLTVSGMACDGCNIYTPAGFNNSQHKIGIFARQRSTFGEFSQLGEMITKHSGHGSDQKIWGAKVLEQYQTYELRGDFFMKEKWQLTMVLPFSNNKQFLDETARFSIAGLSDPTVMISYNFIKENAAGIKHRLSFGGGARFPIGLISIKTKNGMIPNLDFQPGTGAYSGLCHVNYFVTNDTWSGFFGANYKTNGFNSLNYKYGQTFNINSDLFWQTNIKESTFMLHIGAYTELADHDQSVIEHKDTGGIVLFGTIGLRYLLRNFIIQSEFQPVVMQRLFGSSQLLTKNRINIGLTYVL